MRMASRTSSAGIPSNFQGLMPRDRFAEHVGTTSKAVVLVRVLLSSATEPEETANGLFQDLP